MKYLLSTGEITEKIEYYILDLFRLYLNVYPRDIPGAPQIGFNFIFNNVKKDEIVGEVQSRVSQLAATIKSKISGNSVTIEVDSIEIIDESRVRITITINENVTDSITLDVYDE